MLICTGEPYTLLPVVREFIRTISPTCYTLSDSFCLISYTAISSSKNSLIPFNRHIIGPMQTVLALRWFLLCLLSFRH